MSLSSGTSGQQTPQPIEVVVTAPSSPETQQATPRIANILAPQPKSLLYPEYAMQPSGTAGSTTHSSSHHVANAHIYPPSRFDELLASSDLPDPGPAHFVARRALWLQPTAKRSPHRPRLLRPNLQTLLEGPPESLYEESNWDGGVGKICERLLSGESLSSRLPLKYVVRVHVQFVPHS